MSPTPEIRALVAIARARDAARYASKPCYVIRDRNGNWLAANAAALEACDAKGVRWQGNQLVHLGWSIVAVDGRPIRLPDTAAMRAIRSGETESGIFGLYNIHTGRMAWLDLDARPENDGDRRILVVNFSLVDA